MDDPMTNPAFARLARLAGVLYLGIILLGLTGEVALRGPLIDWSDGAATAAALGRETLRFRLSVGFDLTMAAFDIAVAFVFLRMLQCVHRPAAITATILRLIQAAILVANALLVWPAPEVAHPLPLIARHAAGYDLGLIFFAFNCFVMAWLLHATRRPPRWLPFGIAASGLVYLVGSLTRFFAPDLNTLMQPAYLIPVVAETSLALWLLFGRGARA
ncbi:DUF4386 domain-containing protein [Shimia sp. FJ5]|uniref:DUF4386 domain-containing protein n=1 Tax=Shimia sp. FJ5 TaxID=3079054 RepID=UPI00262CAC21|nr:DUF4386 domain-containing protein [Shimia sp. FJ5]MDV4145320.1 DUF4386 domain-containing protein [Shimia sp. FJ5]